ncbi:MAG: ABC transporter ATP-binding protein [Burkholderiaceae bacterium]
MLRIERISKSFSAVTALREVSLELNDGEFVSFLGPSGCGKTTLLRIIAGLEIPDTGEISVDGEVLASETRFVAPEARRFGMVFQSYALWPHMTVDENLAFPLEIAGLAPEERARRVAATLQSLGLQGLGGRHPAQLSGGQQQRVALGRALVMQPRALLLDEPLSNVDAKVRREMRAEIRRAQRQAGVTAAYVTHDQEEALAMSDRVVVMDNGSIAQVGTPDEIYRHPQTAYVASFIGANVLGATLAAGAAAGAPQLELPELGLAFELHAQRPLSGPVQLAIHPAEVTVVARGTPDAGCATVVDSSYLGERIEVALAAGATSLLASLDSGQPRPVPGSQVGVRLNPAALAVIGAADASVGPARRCVHPGVAA